MKRLLKKYPFLKRLFYFFPFQLLMVQVKKNHVILLFWLVLFGCVTGTFGSRYGVGYLFLHPEYLDRVDAFAYFIVGFSCGGFIIAYNISVYILNAFRFPFLATLSNPFIKFCYNNSIIPLLFLVVYSIKIRSFLATEHTPALSQLLYLLAFFAGNAVFIALSFFYFMRTNKDISRLYGMKYSEEVHKRRKVKRIILKQNMKWKTLNVTREARDWHVETYIGTLTQLRRARSFEHYDKEMLIQVFKQNHYNAVFFEAAVIISLLILGTFRDYHAFMIPAGASIFLLFTMYLVLTGVLQTWFRGWAGTAFIAFLLLLNTLHRFDFFDNKTQAYGMKYNVAPAAYTQNTLTYYDTTAQWRKTDSLQTIRMLENWKAKNQGNDSVKPPFVIFNCSGGGLRSSLWTLHTMLYTDSATGNALLPHIGLICGSSGGMLGAAYMREQLLAGGTPSTQLCENISKDLLNPVAFSIAVNDWFIPLQKITINGQNFSKNRAYALEEKLNENTGYVFEKPLSAYREAEQQARIPMMLFSPTVVNDGRRMVIASQGVSYLTGRQAHAGVNYPQVSDAIEFSRFFEKQGAADVRFSSVLRMSASFPYITPGAQLPSDPVVEVFDAGMRDNYGIVNALRFVYVFREWIAANTSGVVMIQTRDMPKNKAPEAEPHPSLFQSLAKPLGSFYDNLFVVQNYNFDRELEYTPHWLNCPLTVVDFQLQNDTPDRISLSWHLTGKEKRKVLGSIQAPRNQEAVIRVKELLAVKPVAVISK